MNNNLNFNNNILIQYWINPNKNNQSIIHIFFLYPILVNNEILKA